MREIKFRAWVAEYIDAGGKGYMIDLPAQKLAFDCEDGFVLAFGGQGFWACECYDERTPKFIVMQFTGLRDKNEKEIFEGDIVKACDVIRAPYVVSWGDCYWRVDNIKGSFFGCQGLRDHPWEVIGNIYENPELLSN